MYSAADCAEKMNAFGKAIDAAQRRSSAQYARFSAEPAASLDQNVVQMRWVTQGWRYVPSWMRPRPPKLQWRSRKANDLESWTDWQDVPVAVE